MSPDTDVISIFGEIGVLYTTHRLLGTMTKCAFSFHEVKCWALQYSQTYQRNLFTKHTEGQKYWGGIKSNNDGCY